MGFKRMARGGQEAQDFIPRCRCFQRVVAIEHPSGQSRAAARAVFTLGLGSGCSHHTLYPHPSDTKRPTGNYEATGDEAEEANV